MIIQSPGFYGKVPALGDFVSRRLPPFLRGMWDAWLALLTTAARDAAGAEWPEVWLTGPLWHFALGADIVPGSGAAGVLVASADRVGRCFPFTVIGPAPGIPDAAWSAATAALVLQSLDDTFCADALDAQLAALGPPQATSPLSPEQSVWWSAGSDRVAPTRQMLTGLPGREAAAAMIIGRPPN